MLNGEKVEFDYAYITIHGTPGENGIMQGYFELIHLPYSTSGVLVESLTFNKYVLNRYLEGFGVNVAPSILVRRSEVGKLSEEGVAAKVGMPCFVKPAADGSSFGVSKVKNADQLAPALRVAFMESDEVMIEGFMDGTEFPSDATRRRINQLCSLQPRLSPPTSSSTMMPNTTVRCRRLHRLVSLRNSPESGR